MIPVAVLEVLLSANLIYLETYYRADTETIATFSADRAVRERTLESGDLVFDPGNATVGLIFYPGGKVEQDGDGKPSITNGEQIRITAKAITDWLNNGVSSGENADEA